MSGFTRAASRLACGGICWLSACSLIAGWTMDYPSGPYGNTFHKTADVDGTGEAPAADLLFSFKITEHSLGSVWQQDSGMTEDVWWSGVVSPPENATWPVGEANAVLWDETSYVTHETITFTN